MVKKFKSWPLYTLLAGFVVPIVSVFGYAYYEVRNAPEDQELPKVTNQAEAEDASPLVTGLFSYFTEEGTTTTSTASWAALYPNTRPMQIGAVPVEASVAQSWPERIKGLSDTPYLPDEVVKLFVFDSLGYHSIWMKDMKYAIDIIWVDEANRIVHTAQSVSPETYPETFSPSKPALYVIEAVAGFVENHSLKVGDAVTMPELE